MAKQEHSVFDFKQIVVFVFLFLSCLLTAVPFPDASLSGNSATNHSSLPFINQNADQEENNLPGNILNGQQEYHFTLRNKLKVNRPATTQNKSVDCGINSGSNNLLYSNTGFFLRPRYYTFLSIYHLF